MAFLIYISLFFSPILLAFENANYSIPVPDGWSEQKGMFGSDVIFSTPIVGTEQPLTLYLVTQKNKLDQTQAKKLLKEDFEKYVNKKKYKYQIRKHQQLEHSKHIIYILEATLLAESIEEKFMFIVPMEDKYIYGHFDGESSKYHRYLGDVINSVRKLKLK